MRDLWTWGVLYDDGSWFNELAPDGSERGFAEVDLGRARAVAIFRGGEPTHMVECRPALGERPIFFRRRGIELDPNGVEIGRHTHHVLGVQRTIKGRNVSSYCFVDEDGRAFLTDRHDAV